MSPLGSYDQAVAISQDHINESLKRRYNLHKVLQNFAVHTDEEEDGAITATMSPPTLELYIPGEPRKARLFLHFKSGTFDFYAKLPGDAKKTKHTLPIDGWSLAFVANLTRSKLDSIPPDAQDGMSSEIRDKIEKQGSYSLSQILIDVTTSDILDFDFSRSTTPGMSHEPGKDIRQRQALQNLLGIYLGEFANGSHNVLGYTITVTDPAKANPRAPSLPPVSVSPQAMPYSADSSPQGSDAFLFLEMAGDISGRTVPVNALEGSYPWVPPGRGGVMTIGKPTIWDRFLVGRLEILNREAVAFANRMGHWVETQGKEGNDSNVPWILTKDGVPQQYGWTDTKEHHQVSFAWSGKKDDDRQTGTGVNQRKKWSGAADVVLRIEPGTNHITAVNKVSFKFECFTTTMNRSGIPNTTSYQDSASVEWSLTLAFDSVAEGALGLVVTSSAPKCDCLLSSTSYGIFQAIFGGGTIPNDKMTEVVKKVLEDRITMSSLEADVRSALKDHAQFVLPGGGVFFMKEPTFTDDADLRVFLTYKASSEKQDEQARAGETK